MINFFKGELNNGLKILVNSDYSTPLVSINILYFIGSKDENPKKTGFAHLFEHLMFGGSKNIPCFDTPLQNAGGENNAFTNNDYTNYYITIPSQNIETAFWLESDRMLQLAFSQKSLNIQKNVVVEEFKQRYLNQPYGDLWFIIRKQAYKVHPYKWPTIGKEVSHIENATLKDVKEFYNKYYIPSNAILTLSGNISFENGYKLSEKWFAPIIKNNLIKRNIPKEPIQLIPNFIKLEKDVPFDILCKVYHMADRRNREYIIADIISDVFSNGKSSRLYENLVKKHKVFSEIDAFISGDIDEGLFVFYGKIPDDISIEKAEKALDNEVNKLISNPITAHELSKLKNKAEAAYVFSNISCPNKALKLGVSELLGDANLINTEIETYRSINSQEVLSTSRKIFTENNCSTIYYLSKNKKRC